MERPNARRMHPAPRWFPRGRRRGPIERERWRNTLNDAEERERGTRTVPEPADGRRSARPPVPRRRLSLFEDALPGPADAWFRTKAPSRALRRRGSARAGRGGGRRSESQIRRRPATRRRGFACCGRRGGRGVRRRPAGSRLTKLSRRPRPSAGIQGGAAGVLVVGRMIKAPMREADAVDAFCEGIPFSNAQTRRGGGGRQGPSAAGEQLERRSRALCWRAKRSTSFRRIPAVRRGGRRRAWRRPDVPVLLPGAFYAARSSTNSATC